MKNPLTLLAILLASLGLLHGSEASDGGSSSLWTHIRQISDLKELRSMNAEWDASSPDGLLKLTALETRNHYAWAVIPPPAEGWNLARRASVGCEITNRGVQPVNVQLWVVGDRGWDAISDIAILEAGSTRKFSCRLRETFPDGTPKIDPGQIKNIQIMISGRLASPATLEVRGLVATGSAPEWKRPDGRMDVSAIEDGPPSPGSRVRYRLAEDANATIYSVLHLPKDWEPGGKYPVIVEYPGNIYFVNGCYSTGLPDQCVIGYGMSKGQGAISLALPFVDRQAGGIAENGWGNADETADYLMKMVDEVCTKFGGDPANLILTGFSRGAIACGYIGLRNDRIAALWKGMHACQHFDGSGWRGATITGAIERARRFQGEAVFHTDNPQEKVQPVMDAMSARFTFVKSGLGYHSTAMFLDERPSTQQLRQWFRDLCLVPGQRDQ
jgi:hypothetical protein